MKNVLLRLLILFPAAAYAQIITEDELTTMVKSAQEKCVGAHQSIILRSNEEFAKSIWAKTIRLNDAKLIRFFTHSGGEKVSAGVDLNQGNRNAWAYSYDQKTAADLLIKNGVRVTQSYNTLWINANQDLIYAETIQEGKKSVLELYCPQQKFLELLRIGQTHSIEFMITGYLGSVSSDDKIYGVLTQVHAEKQLIKCENGHEFDKAAGYKFCPTCGAPLE